MSTKATSCALEAVTMPLASIAEPPKSVMIGKAVPSATTVAMADAPVRSLMTETDILGKMVWRLSRAAGAARVERANTERAAKEVFILEGVGVIYWY